MASREGGREGGLEWKTDGRGSSNLDIILVLFPRSEKKQLVTIYLLFPVFSPFVLF